MPEVVNHTLIVEKLKNLTGSPGCYLWKNSDGEIIYVGKAKNLDKRIRNYLKEKQTDLKTRFLQREIFDLDWIATSTEKEALILEATLIKKHNPRYNVRLKDDKKYPYLCVSLSEPFPMVFVTRKIKDNGDRYFGPYTDVKTTREILDVIHRIFPVRKTKQTLPLPKPRRPCLNFQMGRCLGPCQGTVPVEDYRIVIDQIIQFLEGKKEILANELVRRMEEYSAKMDFEIAARYRDMLSKLQSFRQKQTVVSMDGGDEDVIAFARKEDEGQVVLMEVRGGRLENKKSFPIQGVRNSTEEEILSSFFRDYYLGAGMIPASIVVSYVLKEEAEAVLDFLQEKTGFRPKLRFPKAGEKRSLLKIAEKNAELSLTERLLATHYKDQTGALKEIQEMLQLSDPPHIIECYDISHFQGSFPVASGVMFVEGKPFKQGYRKYNIRGYEGINDPGMMHEVISRRLQRILNEDGVLPDLIVIDGGFTQLTKACEAAVEAGVPDLPMVGLAKKREEIYFPGEVTPYSFDMNSVGMRLLRHLRDEAHRFGVEHHRSRRNREALSGLIREVPDIGLKRSKLLLQAFSGQKKIEDATIEELLKVNGIGETLAEKIYSYFHSGNKIPTESLSQE
ncbi:excinuclease ABC subunit UvrC [Leptospira wolffii]|uniref:excinuclease ABC subunit UvrC n=1 Tax=Leptospira wolffii TaxID=409998 RepID=UPI0010844A14|nr:excinuclease ABC subunit UvrC [Leptospira wolffii]TGK56807.1 excinuclease ABC subunit UvrC [Leptospira wolffii]TGK71611.1 excinuclease ABC subunit UvrC [Leptospira wolffii]TGK75532.1 excinuclease ABC subunit UvrC [Leptospira wolffii]TGL32978.1 excinuclease ABC subunit UvrC [Leptospira wolffii]